MGRGSVGAVTGVGVGAVGAGSLEATVVGVATGGADVLEGVVDEVSAAVGAEEFVADWSCAIAKTPTIRRKPTVIGRTGRRINPPPKRILTHLRIKK